MSVGVEFLYVPPLQEGLFKHVNILPTITMEKQALSMICLQNRWGFCFLILVSHYCHSNKPPLELHLHATFARRLHETNLLLSLLASAFFLTHSSVFPTCFNHFHCSSFRLCRSEYCPFICSFSISRLTFSFPLLPPF